MRNSNEMSSCKNRFSAQVCFGQAAVWHFRILDSFLKLDNNFLGKSRGFVICLLVFFRVAYGGLRVIVLLSFRSHVQYNDNRIVSDVIFTEKN